MVGLPFQGVYSAAEYATTGLTEALRFEARSFGVHVTLIRAGDVRTEFTANRRHTQATQQGTVYAEKFRTALNILEKDERSGIAPLKVAQVVEKIITARSPRGVYTVGPLFQIVAAYARPLVPARFFEWAVRKYYRLG
jgi:short-subunit dehydrogenase